MIRPLVATLADIRVVVGPTSAADMAADYNKIANAPLFTETFESAPVHSTAQSAGLLYGTDWSVGSGTHKIEAPDAALIAATGRKDIKQITCVTAGNVYIPDTDAPFGSYEVWVNKTDTNNLTLFHIGASTTEAHDTGTQDSYAFGINNGESYVVTETTNGSGAVKMATASDDYALGTWVKMRLNRTNTGVMTTYADDVAVTAVSGTNPFTDTTISTSKYMVAQLAAADKMAIITHKP